MRKTQNKTHQVTQNPPPQRGKFIGNNSLLNHDHTNPPQVRQTFSQPPIPSSTHCTYTTVTLGVLFFGIFKSDFQLLYLACFMVSAPLDPSKLKSLLTFIKENFGLKSSKK